MDYINEYEYQYEEKSKEIEEISQGTPFNDTIQIGMANFNSDKLVELVTNSYGVNIGNHSDQYQSEERQLNSRKNVSINKLKINS